MHVLVIDDDLTIADMVELFLMIEGFEVTVARGGEDGVLAALREQPDAIVLDIMMPKVDGWQVASKLRMHTELADIPIVICTALTDGQGLGREHGAASYITKPFDPAHLVHEVYRVAHGAEAESSRSSA